MGFESPKFEQTPTPSLEEKKEIMPEVFQTIKEDIDKGKCAYSICTKIETGASFKGYQEKDKIPEFHTYLVGSDNILKQIGRRLEREYFDIDFRMNEKYGNAAILLEPLLMEKYIKTKEIQEKKGLLRTKQIEVEVERTEKYKATLKDIVSQGEEEIMRLMLKYPSAVETRAGTTGMSFYLRKDLANKILDEIRKKPENFWELIKNIEPDLLNITRPAKGKEPSGLERSAGEGLSIVERDRYGRVNPIELLQWSKEEIIKGVAESPEIPPDLPPSSEKISDEI